MEIIESINTFSQSLFGGFQITILLLFILKLIFKKQYVLWQHLFLLSNCILLFAALMYGAFWFINLITNITGSDFENNAYRWRVMGPYWYTYWAIVWSHILIPQLLWIKKYRHSYKASIFFMVMLFILGPFMERMIIIATSFYHDYLPSSWTYYPPNPFEIVFVFAVFVFVLLLLYWICRRKLRQVEFDSNEKTL